MDFPRNKNGLPPRKSVESIYGLPEEGTRPSPGNPNRTIAPVIPAGGRDEGMRPAPGNPNLPEEQLPARPVTPDLPEKANFPFQEDAAQPLPPMPEMRGIPSGMADENTIELSPSKGPGLPVPEGMTPPQPESGVKKWWGNLPPEQRAAIQKSLLVTGLSLMAQQKPSRYPISPFAQIGEAGLAGVGAYGQSMAEAKTAAYQEKDLGLRRQSLEMDRQRLSLLVDEAMRKADFESPGIEETPRPNTYIPTQGEDSGRFNLDANLKTGSHAGPQKGLTLQGDTKSGGMRGEKSLPGLNTGTVKIPRKQAGLGYRMKEAELAKTEAETLRQKAEAKKAAATTVKGSRDYIKEKALEAASRASSDVLKFSQGDPDAQARASVVASGVYQTAIHLQSGHRFVAGQPGAPGKSHFFSADEPETPPVPGYWVDAKGNKAGDVADETGDLGAAGLLPEGIPPGSTLIGTFGGKPVYKSPDGKTFIIE